MLIDRTTEEVRAVRDLLEIQIGVLGVEIHCSRTPDHHDSLKPLRESLKKLDRGLSSAAC